MKRFVSGALLSLACATVLSSCYTLTYNVGEGAKTGLSVSEKNHYLVYGLAGIKTSDPTKMAGNAKDYTVTIEHTFVDGVINALTFGIYSPTTTTVTK
ncbi:MAG: Bor family protein [Candidatus Kapaibacterium sp.]